MNSSGAIKELRQKLGDLSQERMAARMGTTTRTIARWESSGTPPLSALLRLAEMAAALGEPELKAKFLERLSLRDEPPAPADVIPLGLC